MKGLTIQNLTTGYNGKAIIEDLTLAVKEKETLVLMGISGSGKTTLLLTILGILTPTKGKILLHEKDITMLPIEERNIGYLPQDYGLFPHLNVSENIAYGLHVRGTSEQEQHTKLKEMLTFVELEGYENRKIQELSGGQRQRVGLARALAINPSLLLLDEPLSNIDQVTKLEVATHMKNLFAKLDVPIILVTHNHEDAIFLSEYLAIMIDGKVEQIGTVKEILKEPKTPFIKRLLMPFNSS
ncbi:ATP-binding cassette domain-containing protein [Candidatus Gottesmanbacteria bacterium]|nr:ATP-binding cassette domain-containing protein [Candidatus Gottesmanbacteria bacterium]